MNQFDWRGGLENAWSNTVAFLPNFLAFLLILIVGYFVAAAIGKIVDKALERVGFERMVERGGIKAMLQRSGFHVSDIIGKVVFYAIMLFVLQMAFGVFGDNPVSDLLTRTIAFLPNILVAIVIVVVAAAIAAGVRDIVRATLGGLSYGRLLATLASGAIVVLGVFAALNQLNIAPEIVNGLFYAMLAIIVGVSVVAIGGGGIQPMRAQWEKALNRVEQEAPKLKLEVERGARNATTDTAVVDPYGRDRIDRPA